VLNFSIDIGGQERTLRCQESCLLSLVGKTSNDRTLHFEFAQYPTLDENIKAASDWGDALGVCLVTMKDRRKLSGVNSRSSMDGSVSTLSPLQSGRRNDSRPTSPDVSARKRVQRFPDV
jgi:hypothetical protein